MAEHVERGRRRREGDGLRRDAHARHRPARRAVLPRGPRLIVTLAHDAGLAVGRRTPTRCGVPGTRSSRRRRARALHLPDRRRPGHLARAARRRRGRRRSWSTPRSAGTAQAINLGLMAPRLRELDGSASASIPTRCSGPGAHSCAWPASTASRSSPAPTPASAPPRRTATACGARSSRSPPRFRSRRRWHSATSYAADVLGLASARSPPPRPRRRPARRRRHVRPTPPPSAGRRGAGARRDRSTSLVTPDPAHQLARMRSGIPLGLPHGGEVRDTRAAWRSWTTLTPVARDGRPGRSPGDGTRTPSWPAWSSWSSVGAVLAAVHHAEVVAHRVGEPFGSLVLAVAVTVIEVALIVTLMVGGEQGHLRAGARHRLRRGDDQRQRHRRPVAAGRRDQGAGRSGSRSSTPRAPARRWPRW